jgi:hypothetical protein
MREYMTHTDEQRRFRRIPFEAKAFISHTKDRWEAQLLDISLKGALLTLPAGWQGAVGQQLDLELIIENGALIMHMQTEVAHIEQDHLGLRCLHIDLDSMAHLRRLVELNLGDANQLNREFHALGSPE